MIPPSNMEISPTTSSPSLYSRTGHNQFSPRNQMINSSKKLQILSETNDIYHNHIGKNNNINKQVNIRDKIVN